MGYHLTHTHLTTDVETKAMPLAKHSCPTCGRAFVHKHHLRRHEKKHSHPAAFTCKLCGYKLHRGDQLRRHTQRKHPGVTHTCEFCQYATTDYHQLQRHEQHCPHRIKSSSAPASKPATAKCIEVVEKTAADIVASHQQFVTGGLTPAQQVTSSSQLTAPTAPFGHPIAAHSMPSSRSTAPVAFSTANQPLTLDPSPFGVGGVQRALMISASIPPYPIPPPSLSPYQVQAANRQAWHNVMMAQLEVQRVAPSALQLQQSQLTQYPSGPFHPPARALQPPAYGVSMVPQDSATVQAMASAVPGPPLLQQAPQQPLMGRTPYTPVMPLAPQGTPSWWPPRGPMLAQGGMMLNPPFGQPSTIYGGVAAFPSHSSNPLPHESVLQHSVSVTQLQPVAHDSVLPPTSDAAYHQSSFDSERTPSTLSALQYQHHTPP
eukprot:m.57720 g.57720  ORF g.57720 m.57720 type:complete len:431 (-) comp13743_c0_seq3:127-1419(-)